jgi:integrase
VNNDARRYEIHLVEAERVFARHLAALGTRCPGVMSVNRTTIRRFLADLCESRHQSDGCIVIDEPRLLRWMIEYAQEQSHRTLALRLSVLSRYFRALAQEGLIGADLLAEFKVQYGRRSWERIAQALGASDPDTALAAFRVPPPSRGPLLACIEAYIELHCSLGKKYKQQAQTLRDLDGFLVREGVSSPQGITSGIVERWLSSLTGSALIRMHKVRLTKRFFTHLQSLCVLNHNPITPTLVSGRLPATSFRPFIYTGEQIVAILAEAKRLPRTPRFPLRAETCHMMIALLYGLGLRHGEARRLRVRDVNLTRQTLFICQTKFHKSRYIPFGPKLGHCLEEFLSVRRTVLTPLQEDDPLFVTLWRRPVSPRVLSVVFPKILRCLGIAVPPGQQPPRLHDLRHAFAVHRLLRWYREGVDVQGRLPALSTFLGHVDPKSTQVYLTITAELLKEANDRFHRHFGYTFDEETHS